MDKNSKTENPTMPETGFIRQADLIKIIPFSPATLWRKVDKNTFPKPVRLSARVVAWRVEDVRKWMDGLTPETSA